jgi:hypothetical protein
VPGSAHADGRPAGAVRTKCRGLGASEANAGAVLIEEHAATLTQLLVTGFVLQGGEEADGPLVSQEVQETSWLSRQGVVAPAAGNLRFWTGLLFLSRASVGSDANGHTTVGYLWVEHRSAARGWFDRNSPHRARSLLRDRKLEEPPRDFP